MSFNASTAAGGSPRTPPLENGIYPARLVQLVNLGIQPRSYKGEDKDPMQEIMLTYELSEEFLIDEDGEPDAAKPRWVSENFPLYNLGAEKATSTVRYKVMDPLGKVDGDFSKLMGVGVILSIVQNPSKKDPTKIYPKISGVLSMKEKDRAGQPEMVNEPRIFDCMEPNMANWELLPDWVQTKIQQHLEFAGSVLFHALKSIEMVDPKGAWDDDGGSVATDDAPY